MSVSSFFGKGSTINHERMLKFYAGLINENDLVYDVGANNGGRTTVFLELGARVVAIEPQLECARRLQEKFGNSPNFIFINKALDDKNGDALIKKGKFDTIASMSEQWIKKVEETGRFGKHRWDTEERVQTTTLDDCISRYGMPSFCKIDVEGYEENVLNGLHSAIPKLSFEFTPEYLESCFICIDHLMSLGNYKFNYCLNESMRYKLRSYKSPDVIKGKLLSLEHDHAVFGDVYACLDI